ncbi:MAG TPA: hypothetical protein VK961_03295 [Chthoniobacter sp.]|nr:hypothetical protein [Chthoniobacter sp.]
MSETDRRLPWIIALAAIAIALLSARPFAGSWNDGSRLAAVESLVDYRTWAIDQSIFVQVPAPTPHGAPYSTSDPTLLHDGTQDKMWIGGHFYSDKSPVPALFMAATYQVVQSMTGLVARERPGWFCYWLTFLSSGVAYVIAVCCADRLAVIAQLRRRTRLLLTASFALGTIALPYTRQVNNHILLLAVTSGLMLLFAREGKLFLPRLLAIGSLIGVGYTIDLGIGPVLVVCTVAFIAGKTRDLLGPVAVLAAAFPWFVLHHALNYSVGGTFLPANAHAAYFEWPGSPFDSTNLTGGWAHASAGKFIGYALDLAAGRRGFLTYNLALFLTLPGLAVLLRSRVPERAQLLFAAGFSVACWLLYSATSTNHAGLCCSVRWFVPLLAPGFYILALTLRERPECETDLPILTAGSVLMCTVSWWQGPWMGRMAPGFWPILIGTLVAWGAYHLARSRAEQFK